MDQELKQIFVREIGRQSGFVLVSAESITSILGAERADLDLVWYHVQGLLIAVGNISKLLWPPKKTSKERGCALRQLVGVPDDSVLGGRDVRNHCEHFDERLEEWKASFPNQCFGDSNVGPLGAIGGVDANVCLRNCDPQIVAITFLGDTYLLEPVLKAIGELRDRAKAIGDGA